jgi:trans-2,3-dihydro-3-hydroxyanthranilate isomerase
MKASFQTVDVFTDRQFGGNPAAVIPDARGLSDAQMQAIANEFNLAETTFVLPPTDSANTARVRIFTPRAEMPFAGHPNVGTAFVLAHQDRVCGVPFDRGNMIFEEIAGPVRIPSESDTFQWRPNVELVVGPPRKNVPPDPIFSGDRIAHSD